MSLQTVTEGQVIADGTEQTILTFSHVSRFSGFVSLSQMLLGDTVAITEYVDFGGGWERYNQDIYNGFQINPALYFVPRDSSLPHQITVQQTAGVMRSYRFKFIEEVIPISGFDL